MGLEYFIELDCAIQGPREAVEFMHRAKIGSIVQAFDLVMDDQGISDEERESRTLDLPHPVMTLLGRKTEFKYPELRAEWQRIEKKSKPHCSDCPVRFRNRALGCYGAIAYPISHEAEQWLIDRFNPHLHSGDELDSYIAHHIVASGVTGQSLDEDRVEPGEGGASIFLPGGPARKKLTPDGQSFTSSQIFEYILRCQPYMAPQTLLALCTDFGAIDLPPADALLLNVAAGVEDMFGSDQMKAPDVSQVKFIFEEVPGEDRGIDHFKGFFKACWIAFLQRSRMYIDG